MNHEIKNLVNKANEIINRTGRGPGIRYPQSLKNIIISLRNEHKLSAKKDTELTGISVYSVREWLKLKKNKSVFKKIKIKRQYLKKEATHSQINDYYKELNLINFNLKVLISLIALLIFLILFLHLSS